MLVILKGIVKYLLQLVDLGRLILTTKIAALELSSKRSISIKYHAMLIIKFARYNKYISKSTCRRVLIYEKQMTSSIWLLFFPALSLVIYLFEEGVEGLLKYWLLIQRGRKQLPAYYFHGRKSQISFHEGPLLISTVTNKRTNRCGNLWINIEQKENFP